MTKEFNVTGLCLPKRHYMADVSQKLAQAYKMIEKGNYFIINRPRQYGKTTTMHALRIQLIQSRDYIVFHTSFEGIGDMVFQDEKMFSNSFLNLLEKYAPESAPELQSFLQEKALETDSLEALGEAITALCVKAAKKVVVLIDEVDKSSNNQLFVSFLGMLRDKYLDRARIPTFHAVILSGVHDVKSLKLKIRSNEAQTYNSPWNIATIFNVNMNLLPHEVKPMLEDYMQEQGVVMDAQAIANRLFYFTSGYPYLTSHLCKFIDEEILPNKTAKEWTEADVHTAFRLLLRERNNANFDTVVKNLKEYPNLYQLVYAMVIDGVTLPYNDYDATISLGILHGIFGRSESGTLMIHNRIYREIIADMMISEWRTNSIIHRTRNTDVFDYVSQYHLPNKGLDMQKVLENFQAFMRKEYSNKDRDFLEREGRLIFLAFIKPIINGVGSDFKEPQISEEKRLDVVITYHHHQYVAELKIWHGEAAHQKGLEQLADYLEHLGLSEGYLLIFDHSKKKTWKRDWVEVKGKRVFWARV